MDNLRKKSVSGVFWALTEKFSVTGVKFLLGIILARLLTPADFGLIGMITVFFIIAEVFVDSGFAMAYVQKKHINEADADTVFYTNLIISIFLFIIIFFSAPLIAHFYEQPQLVELTRVMSLVIIINAFNIIQRAQIIRSVNFKKLTKVTFVSSVL
ncbi:MAG TPA: flippase, partial [Bacteroidales bacterium]|nr:flippase [Bacteroidales bacterium]